MLHVDLNDHIAKLIAAHGIKIFQDAEYVYPQLPVKCKVKAIGFYQNIGDTVSSQLDVCVNVETRESIVESFGDFADDVETAIQKNFQSFSLSSLHPLLSVLGHPVSGMQDRVEIQTWESANEIYKAHIGNISPKQSGDKIVEAGFPMEFFKRFESNVKSQTLSGSLHWFRGYYLQTDNTIAGSEFLMDNDPILNSSAVFSDMPLTSDTDYFSCRCFMILQKQPQKRKKWFKLF